jgi:integrase
LAHSFSAFTIDSFGKVFQRLRDDSGIANFSAHVLRHTWATDFMREPNANLLNLKRMGGSAKFRDGGAV